MSSEPRYVTLVNGESPCRVMDGLADGFIRWLGKERVQLHFLLGNSCSLSEFSAFQPVYEWAKQGKVEWTTDQCELLIISMRAVEKTEEWLKAQKFNCAVATMDVRDKPPDETITLSQDLPLKIPFKAELTYTAQAKETYSCPIGLVPEPIPPLKPWADRTIPISFVAGLSNITREPLARIVSTFPDAKVITDKRLERAEYNALLADTKIGVACYGGGFNSYRYWEIPYYGCLLVAQPLPLMIPQNFQQGKQALFYLKPQELQETLQWALTHLAECEAIAKAGALHLLQHHLTIHRAQRVAQLVEWRRQRHELTAHLETFPF